jgi:hypothetical protein
MYEQERAMAGDITKGRMFSFRHLAQLERLVPFHHGNTPLFSGDGGFSSRPSVWPLTHIPTRGMPRDEGPL